MVTVVLAEVVVEVVVEVVEVDVVVVDVVVVVGVRVVEVAVVTSISPSVVIWTRSSSKSLLASSSVNSRLLISS